MRVVIAERTVSSLELARTEREREREGGREGEREERERERELDRSKQGYY